MMHGRRHGLFCGSCWWAGGSLLLFALLATLTAITHWGAWPSGTWWSLGQAAAAVEASGLALSGSRVASEERAVWGLLALGAATGAAFSWPGAHAADAGRLMRDLWLSIEGLAALASLAALRRAVRQRK